MTPSPYAFELKSDQFKIKIAVTEEDIQKAQKLRHDVFLEEGLGETLVSGLDEDEYDKLADHLMIIDEDTQIVVGTYRLISSLKSEKFYSQNEFHLDGFLNHEGTKLEMGRACTHSEYRNGRTMDLLWQGLSEYIERTRTRYLFGCSSIASEDPKYVFSIAKSLYKKDQLKMDWNIEPVGKYALDDQGEVFGSAEPMDGFSKQLPPLLRSYLHAGSHVYGYPAYDKDFRCFDLLTVLDLTQLTSKFRQRYNVTI